MAVFHCYQECSLACGRESALSFKSKRPHVPAIGLTHSHDGRKIWPLLMGRGRRCSHYSRGVDSAARRQGIQREAELA